MGNRLENRIRVYRAEHRLSQAELAGTIEVGKFVPSTVIALKIAQHFGVPVEDIFQLQKKDKQ